MSDHWDDAVRMVLAPTRELEPTDHELQRVLDLDRARGTGRGFRRRRLIAVALVALLSGTGVYAVPATRAAVSNVYESIAPWVKDDADHAPGRALIPKDDVPSWLREQPGAKRVLAEAGGVELIVTRASGDTFTIALGNSFGQSGTLDDWRQFLGEHAVTLVGPADVGPNQPFDANGRRPLFGLAADSVARVELIYASGPPSTDGDVHGGFGFLADATRPLRALVAYDRNGRQVERRDMRGVDLRVCSDVRGCPPGHLIPRRKERG